LSVVADSANINGLEVLEFEPRGKAAVADGHLLKGVLVRQADGSVQLISFFVNDRGLADLPAARQLVTEVIATLKPGPRKLVSGAVVQLAGRRRLTLDLPPDYTAYRQQGPDFDVYWIEHLVALDQPAGRLGIYYGDHPQRPAYGLTIRAERAVLFGVDVEWRGSEESVADGSSVIFRREAFVPLSTGQGTLHVFFHAMSDAEFASFQGIAQTARCE